MYYKIIEKFGTEHEGWKKFTEFRKLKLTRFDSVDGILCPDLFKPESEEDWANCVNDNFKLNLITNLKYARSILKRFKNAILVGVDIELEKDYMPKDNLLGFDIIDGYCDVSLLTNWGNDEDGIFVDIIKDNGLIEDLETALKTRDTLRYNYPKDPHAEKCEVWGFIKLILTDPPDHLPKNNNKPVAGTTIQS